MKRLNFDNLRIPEQFKDSPYYKVGRLEGIIELLHIDAQVYGTSELLEKFEQTLNQQGIKVMSE